MTSYQFVHKRGLLNKIGSCLLLVILLSLFLLPTTSNIVTANNSINVPVDINDNKSLFVDDDVISDPGFVTVNNLLIIGYAGKDNNLYLRLGTYNPNKTNNSLIFGEKFTIDTINTIIINNSTTSVTSKIQTNNTPGFCVIQKDDPAVKNLYIFYTDLKGDICYIYTDTKNVTNPRQNLSGSFSSVIPIGERTIGAPSVAKVTVQIKRDSTWKLTLMPLMTTGVMFKFPYDKERVCIAWKGIYGHIRYKSGSLYDNNSDIINLRGSHQLGLIIPDRLKCEHDYPSVCGCNDNFYISYNLSKPIGYAISKYFDPHGDEELMLFGVEKRENRRVHTYNIITSKLHYDVLTLSSIDRDKESSFYCTFNNYMNVILCRIRTSNYGDLTHIVSVFYTRLNNTVSTGKSVFFSYNNNDYIGYRNSEGVYIIKVDFIHSPQILLFPFPEEDKIRKDETNARKNACNESDDESEQQWRQ